MSEIRDARARRDTSLRSRERVVEASSAIAFVATAFAFALGGRGDVGDLRIATAATLIAMLGALGQVEFEIGRGAAVPTQLASVPLAFLTPPGFLPLANRTASRRNSGAYGGLDLGMSAPYAEGADRRGRPRWPRDGQEHRWADAEPAGASGEHDPPLERPCAEERGDEVAGALRI